MKTKPTIDVSLDGEALKGLDFLCPLGFSRSDEIAGLVHLLLCSAEATTAEGRVLYEDWREVLYELRPPKPEPKEPKQKLKPREVKVLDALRASGRAVTIRQIIALLHGDMSRSTVQLALLNLGISGEVTESKVYKKGGDYYYLYRAVE
jgi:hypothetical protein